jgi:hypothetical protein
MQQSAQSIARQRLGEHPATDVHATIEGRPSLVQARNTRMEKYEECFIARQRPARQWSG